MRRLWLVVPLVVIFLQVGCKQKSPSMLHADQALPGCVLAGERDAKEALKFAKPYFREKVGAEIDSMVTEAVSVCGAHWVVPIEATTKDIKTPRLWFVEVNRESPNIMSLIRPE